MPTRPLYYFPSKTIRMEQEIKHSRFITTMGRVENREAAESFINSIRNAHADAAHNCWAFIAGNPHDTTDMGASDDGEPQGTAGKPMLSVLQHKHIGEVAVVVTRYFGGIKLGTGGLVRAYSGSVQQAIDNLPLTPFLAQKTAQLIIEYPDESTVRRVLEMENLFLSDVIYGQDIRMIITVPESLCSDVSQKLADLTRGRAVITWETD